MSGRLRGEEVQVVMTRGGVFEDAFTNFLSMTVTLNSEVMKQGYLGQDADDVDDRHIGVDGELEMHTQSPSWVPFVLALLDRQQRRTPDVIFNIAFTMFYPNGESVAAVLQDVKFGSIPIAVSARGAYVSHRFTYSCRRLQLNI